MSIADVAERVEADPDSSADPADADRGAGPGASADPDLGEMGEPTEPGPKSMMDRLKEPMEGSIREDRVGELWNPEQGGLNRLALVAEETVGLGDGLPRAFHAVIGIAEAYLSLAEHADTPDEDASEQEEDTNPQSDTAEILEYSS